jgi:hypothetical protein
VLEADDSMEPIYVNFAEVSQGQYECEINFARTPAKLSADRISALQDGGAISIYPLVKLILPTALLPNLVKAISSAIALPTQDEQNEHAAAVAETGDDIELRSDQEESVGDSGPGSGRRAKASH